MLRLFARGPKTADPDVRVIDALRRAGADLARPRSVRHYLYLPSQQAATDLAEALGRDGFHVHVSRSSGAWLALAQHTAIVTRDAIGGVRERLSDLVASLAGVYDGWEATIRP